ncbi:hypothetical protein BC938DRAFT_472341 [Jimgerdemannia flammicorona]|uniref:MATH domain-containing protein n=1 Tax=Jimgerdemannia flammicorona TaxID=994334 RepID=A0A433Q6A9_9FUNG|nr:hypothetical protein BC938DRAFT_472341 [Jimgerdemannia flammicorona]
MDLSGEQATPIDLDKTMSDVETDPPVSIHEREYFAPFLPITDEAIASKIMPDLGQDIDDFQVFHWQIKNWRSLEKRLNGPEFVAGGFNW